MSPEERTEMKTYSRWADAYTPLAKGMGSEFANQNAYDAVQIHGGSGYMKDYACERWYRDARITSIYEGTTQLQVIAAIRYVTTGAYLEKIKAYQQEEVFPEFVMRQRLLAMTAKYEKWSLTLQESNRTVFWTSVPVGWWKWQDTSSCRVALKDA